MDTDKPTLRFNFRRYQFVLLIVMALNFVALGSSTSELSQGLAKKDLVFSSVQNRAQSLALLQRESLAFTIRFTQWRGGQVPLADVEDARDHLSKRLVALKISGNLDDGDRPLVDKYASILAMADEIILNSMPGILTTKNSLANEAASAIFIDETLRYSRVFSTAYRVQLDHLLAKSAKDYRQVAEYTLRLLVLFIFLFSIFIYSGISSLNRKYRLISGSIESQLISLNAAENKLVHSEILIEKLKLLDRRKNNFISTINHELRTPLTSIIGYVSILRKNIGASIDSQTENILNVIERNSEDLLNLVEEILTLSSLESSTAELETRELDVQAIIRECVLALIPQSESLDVTFAIDVEENIDTVIEANKIKMSLALSNILSNSLKFSKIQTQVQINISERYGEELLRFIRIAVTDQGIGIPESQIEDVFTSFFRASNAQSSGIPGSGLGLAITSQIIELHKGSIKVASTEGIGSTFTIELPAHISELQKMIRDRKGAVLERAITAIESSAYADLEKTCHEMIGVLGFYELGALSDEIALFSDWLETDDAGSEDQISSQRVELLRKLKRKLEEIENLGGGGKLSYLILFVDDNPDIRAFVRLSLESEDFCVIEAIDGNEALKRFEEEKPSLIILDIGIGQPDGLEICRRIRKVSDVPIVMLTSQADEITEAMCLAAGANDYITKPVSKIILGLRVKNQLRWKNQECPELSTNLTADDLSLNTLSRELKVKGIVVPTTRTEFDFILVLMEEPNRVFTREQVCKAIGVSADFSSAHLLDTHASRLRLKIIAAGGPRAISAVRAVGFRLF